MSKAIRIRRVFLEGAEDEEEFVSIALSIFTIDRTLLRKVLSNFDQIHALLTSIDLLNECKQVTSAEHLDDTRLQMILIWLNLDELSRWIFCYEK